ncbi:MAG: hypothetical protein L0216_05105 [Planctomycetales bacterium]|nr:hypothetical protein [Planctomycetales bacterium]
MKTFSAAAGWGFAGTAGLLLALAGEARAQQYRQTEFQEFLINEKEYHGKRISMHAQFISDVGSSSDPQYNETWFKNNGINDEKFYRFTLNFRSQTKEWLFPVLRKEPANEPIWADIQKLKKGEKITVYGRVKRMGDAREGDSNQTGGVQKERRRGGYVSVPSTLEVEKVKRGWVKTLPEYIQDLGDETLVEETIVMLKREGASVASLLLATLQREGNAEAVRAHSARALAEFPNPDMNPKLEAVIKKDSSEKIRNACIITMAKFRLEDAVKLCVRMLTEKGGDPDWAAGACAEMAVAGVVTVPQVREAFADAWDKAKETIAESFVDKGKSLREKKEPAKAERYLGYAIDVDPNSGEAFYQRGLARADLVEQKPEMGPLATKDFTRAVELGVSEPDLFLRHAEVLLKNGDKSGASAFAEKVLAVRPSSIEAKRVKAQAEGKSLSMLDAKTVTSKGLSLRLPAAFKVYPEYTKEEHPLYASWLIKSPSKPGEKAIVIGVDVYRFKGGPEPGSLGVDPKEHVKKDIAEHKMALVTVDRIKLEGEEGADAAYGIGEENDPKQGAKKTFLSIIYTRGGHTIAVLFHSDPKTFDAELPTFLEVVRSVKRVQEEAPKAG